MNICSPIEKILNDQIKYEFTAAYDYLALSAALNKINFPGFAHWMQKQYEEELTHAKKIFDYVQERQGEVRLQQFPCPYHKLKKPFEAFEIAYDLEIVNTKHIYECYELALKMKDHPTVAFLQWFITEQVEEESNCIEYISLLEKANDSSGALLAIDSKAASR